MQGDNELYFHGIFQNFSNSVSNEDCRSGKFVIAAQMKCTALC